MAKKLKKMQPGGTNDSEKKKVGMTKDQTGNYNIIKEYNTPGGKRFYSATSPDMSTAVKISDFKSRTNSPDSISSKLIIRKKGGAVKTKKKK